MKHLVELGVQLTGAVLLQERIGAVANDGQQPGTRVVTAESVEEAERAHNGLLRDILGIVVVAQEPTGEVVPRPHVGQHHRLERVDSMRQYPSERPGPTAATRPPVTLFPRRRIRSVEADERRASAASMEAVPLEHRVDLRTGRRRRNEASRVFCATGWTGGRIAA